MNPTVVELPTTVESLSDEIRGVVYERQTLRSVGAGRDELERNRAELVRLQQELVHALIQRHLPTNAAARTGYPVPGAVAVAQLVEPRVVVPVVAGSSPVRHPRVAGAARLAGG